MNKQIEKGTVHKNGCPMGEFNGSLGSNCTCGAVAKLYAWEFLGLTRKAGLPDADADIYASAPMLLEALNFIRLDSGDNGGFGSLSVTAQAMVNNAIAKAEGRS